MNGLFVVAGCAAALLLVACAPPQNPQGLPQTPQVPPPVPPAPQSVITGDTAPPAANDSAPVQTSTGAMAPVIYRLQMPYGANSRDDSFWKLVEEDVVDVPTDQRLILNGFRVGRGKVADWPTFLKILTNEGAIMLSRGQVLAQSSYGDAPYDMTETMPEELLLIYDEHGLTMRSFDDCVDSFSMAFGWAPRKPRTIRVTICPVVVATKTRADFAMANNPPPQRVLYRESFYDLNLRADVSPGDFLVLGTSQETGDPNRMASLFLTRNGPNQRFEEMLLVVGDSVPMVPARYHKGAAKELSSGATTRDANR